MKNFALFAIAFLTMAMVLLAGEVSKMRKDQPDYQAYTRPKVNLEEMK